MSTRQKKEDELKELMMMQERIEAVIESNKTNVKILEFAVESCIRKVKSLKEELRVR